MKPRQRRMLRAPRPRSHARRTDPTSSHEAAKEAFDSGRAQNQAMRILEIIVANEGQTSKEIARLAKGELDRHQVARRLPDLEAAGLVQKGQQRKCSIGCRLSLTWWSTAGGRRLIASRRERGMSNAERSSPA